MWGLKELPLPEPISWLPATPAWLLVGALLLALFGWLAWRRQRSWQRAQYRREALARIAAMRGGSGALAELPLVLRATALAAYPREEVASLRGAAWLEWLNENGGRFEPGDEARLDQLPYQPGAAAALEPEIAARLVDASHSFVRGHRARL
jgi:LPXTG-motif cell wall-anchored protein